MRCCYCNHPVVGNPDVTIVPSSGPAHAGCHHRALASRRVFKNIELARLTDAELLELREMVLTEANSRQVQAGGFLELF